MTTGGAAAQEAPPRRIEKLGFWMTLALVMGNIIGSGVYLLPASLAPYGWNAAFGWLFTIAGALCLATVLAALARAFPRAGGPNGFIDHAFGPLPAFLVSWSYLIALWTANVALATAAVSYLGAFAPGVVTVGDGALFAVGLIWLVTAVNLLGARSAGGFQILTLTLKVLPLIAVAIIAAALFGAGTPTATPFAASDISAAGIAATSALALWAMLGFESATLSQAKVVNADTVVPRATLLGTVLAGLAYLSVCAAILAYLPADQVAKSNAPFADFISVYWGRWPSLLVALFAAVSAIGALNGYFLLQGEIPRVMAEAGQLPRWFAKTDARGTPVRNLVVSGLIGTGFTLMNTSRTMGDMFTFMALLSTATTLVLYLACAAATLRLMQVGRMKRTPGLLAITLAGVVYSIWTFYGAGLEVSGWTLVLIVGSIPIYWGLRRQKAVVPVE